jgi:hypothetical protein
MPADNYMRGVTIVTVLSIALLVTAGNLSSPPLWLLLPSWLALGMCIAVRIGWAREDSPYKQAFYLLCIPLLFGVEVWLKPFLELVFEPSGTQIIRFMTGRPFLVLAVLYFAAACFFYSKQIEKYKDDEWKRHEDLQKAATEQWFYDLGLDSKVGTSEKTSRKTATE